MKKPKTLYRYDINKTLVKHTILKHGKLETALKIDQITASPPETVLWRCTYGELFPVYHLGYSTKIAAIKEEISNSYRRVSELRKHIVALEKKMRVKNDPKPL